MNRLRTSGQAPTCPVAQLLHSSKVPAMSSDRMYRVSLSAASGAAFLLEVGSSRSWRSVPTLKAFLLCSSQVSQARLFFSQLRVSHHLLAKQRTGPFAARPCLSRNYPPQNRPLGPTNRDAVPTSQPKLAR